MLNIVLFQPEIPGNTGNVIRLCANTGAHLHLIEPLGFSMDDKRLRRAGLDYHEWATVRRWPDWLSCWEALDRPEWYALSTRGERSIAEAGFREGDVVVFGRETSGLPQEMRDACDSDHLLRLPMLPESRSLNLSNAVAVVVYEAWRQMGYRGAR